jgi:Flp pilus assembly pilin Flp
MNGSHAGTPLRGLEGRPSLLGRLTRDRQGASAVEFALIGSILFVLLLNVVDFSRLIWSQMQVEFAAAAGAQAAYNTCSPGPVPATDISKCPTLNNAVMTAAQSTSLGTAVSLVGGAPSEACYCTSGTTLQPPDGYPCPPPQSDCGAFGQPQASPGDYITVKVTYTFAPLFSGLSLVQEQQRQALAMQRLK